MEHTSPKHRPRRRSNHRTQTCSTIEQEDEEHTNGRQVHQHLNLVTQC